jgi:psiF repeat
MRFLVSAVAACLVFSLFAASVAIAWTAPPSGPTAATPAPPAGSTPTAGSDDAAKHAKRTTCLKEAKTKKLVGAQKTAFIKDCVGAA